MPADARPLLYRPHAAWPTTYQMTISPNGTPSNQAAM
jgi:hypothetical protein